LVNAVVEAMADGVLTIRDVPLLRSVTVKTTFVEPLSPTIRALVLSNICALVGYVFATTPPVVFIVSIDVLAPPEEFVVIPRDALGVCHVLKAGDMLQIVCQDI
jgi:hypothetical protein